MLKLNKIYDSIGIKSIDVGFYAVGESWDGQSLDTGWGVEVVSNQILFSTMLACKKGLQALICNGAQKYQTYS